MVEVLGFVTHIGWVETAKVTVYIVINNLVRDSHRLGGNTTSATVADDLASFVTHVGWVETRSKMLTQTLPTRFVTHVEGLEARGNHYIVIISFLFVTHVEGLEARSALRRRARLR